MTKNQLKPTIELAPGRLSGRQLRHRLLPNLEKKIERRVLERARYTCEVVGQREYGLGRTFFSMTIRKKRFLAQRKECIGMRSGNYQSEI